MKVENYKLAELYGGISLMRDTQELGIGMVNLITRLLGILKRDAILAYSENMKTLALKYSNSEDGKAVIKDELAFNKEKGELNMMVVDIDLPEEIEIRVPVGSKIIGVPTMNAFSDIRGDKFRVIEG